MPRNKDLKRIIRGRMKKTGESYTAARAHVLSNKTSATKTSERPAAAVNLAALAGMKDEAIAAKTGRTWQQWLRALDADGAATLSHRDVAAIVHKKYGVGDWWAQSVTVGYERIKGLRERGQRRNGTYAANKSRTFPVPVNVLFNAWADGAVRRRWLDGGGAVVRTASAPKSMRIRWPDGTLVAVGFMAKGAGRSTAALSHEKLRDRAACTRAKAEWTARLDALASLLAKRSST